MLIAAFDPGSASGAFAVVDIRAGVLAIDDFPNPPDAARPRGKGAVGT